jgi:hypothetical protein
MADDPAELQAIGRAILAQVPVAIRPDWVAYVAGNYDREEGEKEEQFIGRWWKYEQILLPLREVDKEAADVPPRDWSLTP